MAGLSPMDLLGEDANPVLSEVFVIEQDEEHVEQGYQGADDADDVVGSLADELEHVGHGLANTIGEVLAFDDAGDFFTVVVDPLLYDFGDAGDMGGLMDIGGHEVAQFAELFDHGRDDEPDDASHDGNDEDEGHNNTQRARGYM